MVDRVAAVPRSRGLQDLTGHQTLERLGLDAYGLRAQVGQDVRRAREEEVAGEDRDGVVPARVGAVHPAAHFCLVHHVVVVKRRQMCQFDHYGRRYDSGCIRVAELGSEHHEKRTKALTPSPYQMLRGLRDERDLTLGGIEQPGLDSRQSGLDIGVKCLVPHPQPEWLDDGHEGISCLLTITRIVDVSLSALKAAYPVRFRSP